MPSENTCAKSLAPRSVRMAMLEVTGHRLLSTVAASESSHLPVCSSCRHALTTIAVIDAADRGLDLERFEDDLIHVLTCVRCDASLNGSTHYRRSRSGKSLVVVEQPTGTPSSVPICRVEHSRELAFPEFDVHSFEGPFHQLGGEPVWLAEPEPQLCRSCREPMVFVLALDSDEAEGIEFADNGMLYAFACASCHEYATFVQSAD